MQKKFTLEWLDFVITVTLNPAKTDLTNLTEQHSNAIIAMASLEKDKVQGDLKAQVYALKNQLEIELLIRRYHADLVILLDQLYANRLGVTFPANHLDLIFQATVDYLKELLGFIENRYGKFLGLDERVPITYLHVCREEMRKRLALLNSKLFRRISDKTLTKIVIDTLQDFIDRDDRPSTLRDVLYKKDLVKALEEITALKSEPQLYKALNEVLIYQNFNKKKYLNYFTGKVAGKVNSLVAVKEKLDQLLLSYKEFNQMHKKPGVRLNAHYADIKKVVGNWFAHEINYLQTKYQWDVNPLGEGTLPTQLAPTKLAKTTINLTVDQMGLIVMALFEVGILISKSASYVFKTLVPYLSSVHQKDISWNSMRRKAYNPEQHDRDAVIAMLESLIKHIRENENR